MSFCESLHLFSTNSQSWRECLDFMAPSESMKGKMTENSAPPLTGRESKVSRCTALEEEEG